MYRRVVNYIVIQNLIFFAPEVETDESDNIYPLNSNMVSELYYHVRIFGDNYTNFIITYLNFILNIICILKGLI